MKYSGEIYRCSAGETFDSIALALYGEEAYACELMIANPALSRTPVFVGGEILLLPVVVLPENGTGNQYTPANAPWKE